MRTEWAEVGRTGLRGEGGGILHEPREMSEGFVKQRRRGKGIPGRKEGVRKGSQAGPLGMGGQVAA